ncbi:FadD3 family acyl-CoA ligase [Kutzneria kofuensis]|uniref:Acyl-CoA synthetase (AMP-forming)/AMP-acid ligase II n=1 Tax=Kutzneria kofuensis TaxID=103725 RepID=A0A7W9KRC8_9PSEU|nr:FadD3 family acyl-CoA ligase [Kutzneria kofuensis]MBB5897300.1 acyl-CoA synthetase (AMP-forming)/AMP-acid ligase II [Kutzneria kofuensis]
MAPSTIPAAVDAAAERFGDNEAVVDGEVRLTYRDLRTRVRQVAAAFVAGGLRPGDRVAICAPNTWHWVVAALGASCAGGVLVPVNTRFTAPEMLDVISRSEAAALVVATDFLGRNRLAELQELGGVPGFVLVCDDWSFVDEVDAVAVQPDDISDILFTSGTTGRSKGAMSAHRQALAVAAAWADCGNVVADDRYLVINPFFHSFGYKAGILVCLLTGATLVPQAVFDVARTRELVERERITVLPGPPTIYQSLLSEPGCDSLRLAVTGAATVPIALVERMQKRFGTVLTAYGLTEAVVATMCRPDDDADTVAHTSGRATAGFEVKIASSGEILLRGPNVMIGYLDDAAATAAAIDADGWLHTGDVGILDDRGYLTITDRLKDMYVCGGFNVYPAEVEQALARLAGVTESAVIGVPDERMGEVGKAFVVASTTLSTEDVIEHCRALVANYKVPRHVEFLSALPRNPSGKVLKRLLREEVR